MRRSNGSRSVKRPKNAEQKKKFPIRYIAITAAFAVLCVIFLVVLAIYQIKGAGSYIKTDIAETKTFVVAGIRGEIYDTNGKKLVGNSPAYDMIYEYGSMPNTYAEINASLLDTIDALERTGNSDKLCEDYFVIDGFFPNVTYCKEFNDYNSDHYYYFKKICENRELDLDISAKDLAEYFINRYKLSDELYSPEEIRQLMRLWYEMERVGFGAYQTYTIANDVSMELVTYVAEKRTEGVTFKNVTQRVYYFPGVASHILGRVGKITAETAEHYTDLGYSLDSLVGTSGCEEVFEKWLHGQDGIKVINYDKDGNIINEYYEVEPMSGNDLWLTIDIDLQIAAEQALAEGIDEIESAEAGALTAIDPNSGKTLAIASYPTYDLTQMSDQQYYDSLLESENTPLFNRALQGVYAPGSTYKIGVALAALENEEIDASTEIFCNQVFDGYHRPTCLGKHENIDIFEAIQESCNIFFYTLGDMLGIDKVTEYTERLGLGSDTGFELYDAKGSVAGAEYRKETGGAEWSAGDNLPAAIGQSDHGYTPLQLSVYMASMVNGGTRYGAHILDSVKTFYTGETVHTYDLKPFDEIAFSDETLEILKDSMGRVIYENAEVYRYFDGLSVKAGGKTGTAEVAGQTDNALFSGFAPFDEPEIVVSCIIEEGEHGYNAAKVVARVMEAYFDKGSQSTAKGD
ncbi:MAG: hypothetical protein IKL59_01075 [Clostridia bacterium]|nr:hypothetical protein [Clostridia bacterium]